MRLVRSLLVALPGLCVLCGCSPRPPVAKVVAPKPPPATVLAPAISTPALDIVFVGRVRGYREWLGLAKDEPVPPVIALLQQEVQKESPIAADVDWDGATEFVGVLNPAEAPKSSDVPETDEPGATTARPNRSGFRLVDLEEDSAHSETEDKSDSEETKEKPSLLDRLAVAVSVPLRTYAPEKYPNFGFTAIGAGVFTKGGCLVSPPSGADKARLLCSDKLQDTKRMQAYLTQRLPREPLSRSPIFAELRLARLREAFAPLRQELTADLARVTASAGPTATMAKEVAGALLVEADAWVDSADAVRFEAGTDSSGAFQFSLRLGLNSTKPWLFRSYLAAARAVHEPPPALLALGDDVSSFGFQFGLPEKDAALIQSTLLTLGRTALIEYGPVSRAFSDSFDAKQSKTLDEMVGSWLELLDAPCFRANHVVWGSGDMDMLVAPNAPASIPVQEVMRAYVGFHVIATPTSSTCPAVLNTFMRTVENGYSLLPKEDRDKLPIQISHERVEHLSGKNELSIRRITISKKAVDEIFDIKRGSTAGEEFGWHAATKPAVFSIVVAKDIEHRGTDWFAFGFDEKELIRVLGKIAQPASASVRSRTDLAQLSRATPFYFTHAYPGFSDLVKTMLPDKGEAAETVKALVRGASLESTVQVTSHANTGEIAISYGLSKETMNRLRSMLRWEKDKFVDLMKQLEKLDKPKKSVPLSGPVGIRKPKK